jgi:hypothetical protein
VKSLSDILLQRPLLLLSNWQRSGCRRWGAGGGVIILAVKAGIDQGTVSFSVSIYGASGLTWKSGGLIPTTQRFTGHTLPGRNLRESEVTLAHHGSFVCSES